MEEGKDVKTPPKETLTYISKEYSVERKGEDRIIKESYYEPRSEEEKKQIIERNRKGREQEVINKENEQIKVENYPNSDEKNQKSEKETNQPDFSQKIDNQESSVRKSSLQNGDNKVDNSRNIYY